MKSTVKAVALFTLFGLAYAQSQTIPPFQHVIIVIQENRSTDNLFGAATLNPSNLPTLGPGVDLEIAPPSTQNGNQPGQPWCLGACFDPDHGNTSWGLQYNGGGPGSYMSCPSRQATNARSCPGSTCNGRTISTVPNCPQETYVSPTDDMQFFPDPQNPNWSGPLVPYFSIANQYGFANYFFQTNQGASQPAHDFLFGGTSAPAGSSGSGGLGYGGYYQYFAGTNPDGQAQPSGNTDCDYAQNPIKSVNLVFPNGTQLDSQGQQVPLPPCFDHLTLADLLTNNGYTWGYYTNKYYDIWTAPSGIAHICYGPGWTQNTFPYPCDTPNPNYTGFTSNVFVPSTNFFADDFRKPGGTNLPRPDLCNLPSVAWIIPNGYWSDHPGYETKGDSWTGELGPDWVASIINAVGESQCWDTLPGGTQVHPWDDTVIFVVWDDWGGFYDHVANDLPIGNNLFNFNFGAQALGGTNPCFFQSIDGGNWGCGYTYGWRVPFLVVSKWTPDGYISGDCTESGSCPNFSSPSGHWPYVHDFGSILAFIESNFGLGVGCINNSVDIDNSPCPNPPVGGTGQYPFADFYFPEGQAQSGSYPPLGDFFGLYSNSENYYGDAYCQTHACPKSFEPIECVTDTKVNYQGTFCPGYFSSYDGPIQDPDNDVIDNISD